MASKSQDSQNPDTNPSELQSHLPIIPFTSITLSLSKFTPTHFIYPPTISPNPPKIPATLKIPSQIASIFNLSLSTNSVSVTKSVTKSTVSANPLSNTLSLNPRRPSDPSGAAALRRVSVVWFRNDLRVHDNESLNKIGLPSVDRMDLAGERLNSKYKEARIESEARIRDAMFFQIASDGWKSGGDNNHLCHDHGSGGFDNLVNLSVNLPNRTGVFRRVVFTSGYVFSKNAEDVLLETIREICGSNLQQCVGIVSDRFKSTALRNIENQHCWMINLTCQFQGVYGLIKYFSKELPLFGNVSDNCYKVANFINNKSHVKKSLVKYQMQEYGWVGLLRVPVCDGKRFMFAFELVFNLVEDVLSSARALQLVLLDEGFKIVSSEDQVAREIDEMLRKWRRLKVKEFEDKESGEREMKRRFYPHMLCM